MTRPIVPFAAASIVLACVAIPVAEAVRLQPTPATEAWLRENAMSAPGPKVDLFPSGFGALASVSRIGSAAQGTVFNTLEFDVSAEAGDAPDASACVAYLLQVAGSAKVPSPFGSAAAGFGGTGGFIASGATSPASVTGSVPLTLTHDPVTGADALVLSEPFQAVVTSGAERTFNVNRSGKFNVRVGDRVLLDFALGAAVRGDTGQGAAEATSALSFFTNVEPTCALATTPLPGAAQVPVNAPWAVISSALLLALSAMGLLARRRKS